MMSLPCCSTNLQSALTLCWGLLGVSRLKVRQSYFVRWRMFPGCTGAMQGSCTSDSRSHSTSAIMPVHAGIYTYNYTDTYIYILLFGVKTVHACFCTQRGFCTFDNI